MTSFDSYYGDVKRLHRRLKNASMQDSVTPLQVRAWEREALSLIDEFPGPWLTYPMRVEGGYPECTREETAYLRKHYRAMTELYAVDALQMPGEGAMTGDEFATRLRSLRDSFTWLSANVPQRLEMHLGGGYSSNIAYLDRELSALGEATLSKQGGCYIATAVYGSYDAPEVLTLRRFRDESLQETRTGRAFIRTYYSVSPVMARHFGPENRLNRVARRALDAVVAGLEDGAR